MTTWSVFEAVHADEAEPVLHVGEPEAAGIEQMRSEIGQHAGALIAPGGIAHQPRRAVAVEHAAGIDRAERARRDAIAHAHEMRLEAMIIGGVDHDAARAGVRLEVEDVLVAVDPERLFDEHAFAVFDAIAEHRRLRLVRDAGEHRVIGGERHILDVLVVRVGAKRIDEADEIVRRRLAALRALHPHACHDDAHQSYSKFNCLSIRSILRCIVSDAIGRLPSTSHSQAAAIAPSTLAIASSPLTSSDSVE